jgi:hypothetical protein
MVSVAAACCCTLGVGLLARQVGQVLGTASVTVRCTRDISLLCYALSSILASGAVLYTEQAGGLVTCKVHHRNHFTVLIQSVVRHESQRTQHVERSWQ